MLAGPTENRNIILYEGLNRTTGLNQLKAKFSQLSNEEQERLKANGEAMWLLRESSSQKGMIAVDYYAWEEANKENNNQPGWYGSAVLLAYFDNEGWVSDYSLKNDMPYFRAITNQNIDDYIALLLDFGQRQKAPQFLLKNLVNPRREKPTKTALQTSYRRVFTPTEQDVPYESAVITSYPFIRKGKRKAESTETTLDDNRVEVKVALTAAMIQAITCAFSGKPFRDPVTMNKDVWVNGVKLDKGISYERQELERLGVNKKNYYDNLNLKFVINRLGCNDEGKIKTLTDERLQDPVEFDTLANPQILPSGHSFSKATIDGMIASHRPLNCPNSRQAFTPRKVVNNINLDAFISAWPECKQLMLATLKKQSETEEEVEVKSETKKRRLR